MHVGLADSGIIKDVVAAQAMAPEECERVEQGTHVRAFAAAAPPCNRASSS
jgi:hypothetical protein